MIFRILYTSPHQNHAVVHCTEWVCPSGYNADQARESFQLRHPNASILQLCAWQL